MSTKVHLRRYGGEGYTHSIENVVPLIQVKGMRETDIRAILFENPQRVLAIVCGHPRSSAQCIVAIVRDRSPRSRGFSRI